MSMILLLLYKECGLKEPFCRVSIILPFHASSHSTAKGTALAPRERGALLQLTRASTIPLAGQLILSEVTT